MVAAGPILNVLVLVGLVMVGLLSNILSVKFAPSMVVIVLSFVSPGVITYAWAKAAIDSSLNAATLGAIAGCLSESCLMVFFTIISRSFSALPNGFRYIAFASIVKMAIIGGVIGIVIDRHSRGRVAPRIIGCLIILSLIFSLLLPCVFGVCPKLPDLLSNRLIILG